MLRDDREYRSGSWTADESEKITGYAVVFEQRTVLFKDEFGHEYGEIVDRNALNGCDMSDVILQYDHQGRVLARTRNHSLKLSIDGHGLKIDADMSGSDEARSIYRDIKAGLISTMSFGFTIADDSWDEMTRTRRIKKIDRLFDVSAVSLAAYPQTEVHARSYFESKAEPIVLEHRAAEVKNIRKAITQSMEERHGLTAGSVATDYRSAEDLERAKEFNKGKPYMFRVQLNERDPIFRAMCELRSGWTDGCTDVEQAHKDAAAFAKLEEDLRSIDRQEEEKRQKIAAGGGKIIEKIDVVGSKSERKEINMEVSEKRAFYEQLLEKRTAATAANAAVMIPTTIYGEVVSKAPGAFLRAARISNIQNTGKIRIPIMALDTVGTHAENTQLTVNGDVPTSVELEHDEYAYLTSYSELAVATTIDAMESMVSSNLMESHNKAMDALLLSKVAGLEYTPKTNEIKVAGNVPTFAEFVELAGLLGDDWTDRAAWYMAPKTYYNWLCGLTDTAKRPILDHTMAVESQAFLGRHINLDSNIPADVVYFGDGSGLYLNHAAGPSVDRDDNFRLNAVDFKVRSVSGAAIVPGCFVKMDKAV